MQHRMSARLHTHYDNLKVAPDASEAVIRAAYRALSQQHHPDRNPDNPDANRIMSLINQSYAVLSDPVKRQAHDQWIAEQRQLKEANARIQAARAQAQSAQMQRTSQTMAAAYQRQREAARPSRPRQMAVRHYGQWLGMLIVMAVLVGAWWVWSERPGDTASAVLPSQPAGTAPNGRALPTQAGYVDGYPVLRQSGYNWVQINNHHLNTGVFAQLYELRSGKFHAIRSVYIPANAVLMLQDVGDGDYSLHYQRLDTGQWQISEPWLIEGTEQSGQYQKIELDL